MKIAIVGSGISGLTCAYHLHTTHELTIFEANGYVGGHTNTVEVEHQGEILNVDTGFIVFNERTYPKFIELLDELKVASQRTEMSFSVACEATGLEYSGSGLSGLFAQKRNLLNPRFFRLLYDFTRFTRYCRVLLEAGAESAETLGGFIERHQFGEMFVEKYLLPMGSAIWSCPRKKFLDFPAQFIAEFYENHGLLNITNRPKWRVVSGGSKQYVDAMTADFRERIQLKTPVVSVKRDLESGRISVQTKHGWESFDHLIFACHSDQALRILGDEADSVEQEVLSAFPYEPNTAILHSQRDLLPKRKKAWSSWNYFLPAVGQDQATLTYNMNILQSLNDAPLLNVTLNDEGRIRDENVIAEFHYHHPTFDARRKTMQQRHEELIGRQGISYCGAYWRNGFHEDGVRSGLAVVAYLKNTDSSAPNSMLASNPGGSNIAASNTVVG